MTRDSLPQDILLLLVDLKQLLDYEINADESDDWTPKFRIPSKKKTKRIQIKIFLFYEIFELFSTGIIDADLETPG